MGPFLKTTYTLSLFAVIVSVYIAFLTVLSVEAFYSSSSATSTLSFGVLHRKIRSQELLQGENTEMSVMSLKATEGEGNSSSLLSSTSKLDIVISGIGSTTSTVVAGTFFAALCYKRDALMVAFFFGAIANAIFGKFLKKILNIERPDGSSTGDLVSEIDRPNDNGMPSSHAMSLGFICTFVALLHPNTTIPLLAYAAISLIYRVKVNLHSVDQIAVGSVLGTFDGAAWWYLCTNGFRGFNLVDLVSSSGIMNESGYLSWYLLAVPALIGAAVVGSVERRLEKYFCGGSSDETKRKSKDK